MTTETPLLLLIAILTLSAAGLASLIWGRRVPRQSVWAVALALLLLFGVAIFGWNEILSSSGPQSWSRGWILPNDERGAVTVGILQDALAMAATALSALLGGFVLLEAVTRKPGATRHRADRILAGVALAVSGLTLAWVSLTPWLSLVGVSFTAFAGFIGLGGRWGEDDQAAHSSTHFAWEKWWGVALAWIGAGIIAGTRTPLVWGLKVHEANWGSVQFSDEVGALILLMGLFVQAQSFPFITWVISPSAGAILPRVFLNQIAPGFSAFALLVRLDPHLRGFGALESFGWICLLSVTITIAAGFVQPTWRQSLAAWISAGFVTAFAILSFSGASGAFGFMVGLVLAVSVLAAAISALGNKEALPNGTSPGWLKVFSFVSVAAGTGFAGFVSSTGILQWISSQTIASGWIALPFFVYFLFTLSGWSLAWGALKVRTVSGAAWYQVLSQFLLLGLALAVVWTGTLSGGFLDDGDRISESLLSSFFEGVESPTPIAGSLILLYFGVQVLGCGIAYWMVGRTRDLWLRVRELFPKTTDFVASGFRLNDGVARAYSFVRNSAQLMQFLLEQLLWERVFARRFSAGFRRLCNITSKADGKLTDSIFRGLSTTVNSPAKFLQIVQNGDVQWYLLFAVGSGVVIVIHFLISKEWM